MRLRVLASFIALSPFSAMGEEIPGSKFGYGNWHGEAYTFDTSGSFSHCAVSAYFQSGDTLIFTVNEDVSVSVAVISPGLNLVKGQTFPVTLYVDNRRPFYGSAEALDANFAGLRLTDFDLAMSALQKGRTLVVESAMGSGTYDLTGTFRALEGARNCAVNYYQYASGTVAPAPSTPVTTTDRTVLFQIATEMIAQTGATNFRYLDAAETKAIMDANAVFWTAEQDGIFGGVLTVPLGEAGTLRASDASDTALIGNSCEGELATSSRAISIPDLEAREIRALCVTGDQNVESLLTKVLVGDQVLYTLLVFSNGALANEQDTRQTMSEDVAIRAASYIKDSSSPEQ